MKGNPQETERYFRYFLSRFLRKPLDGGAQEGEAFADSDPHRMGGSGEEACPIVWDGCSGANLFHGKEMSWTP